jgi:hypothetical protein
MKMAKSKAAESEITILHLVNTLDRIEEWVGLVKEALLGLDPEGRVYLNPTSGRKVTVRERGKACQGVVPKNWGKIEVKDASPK